MICTKCGNETSIGNIRNFKMCRQCWKTMKATNT